MSVTLSKRSYDSMTDLNPQPLEPISPSRPYPQTVPSQFLSAHFGTPPKRCRLGYTPASPTQTPLNPSTQPMFGMPSHSPLSDTFAGSSLSHKPIHRPLFHDVLFKPSETVDETLEDMDRFLPRRKRTRARDGEEAPVEHHTMQRTPSSSNKEVTFTLDEVRAIVAKALQEREDQLKVEFSTILKEKLAEQFENFSKFNEDYVSRQLRESQWDYML